jgi:hypothetical protein
MPIMKTAGLGRDPHFLHRCLAIDDDLAAVVDEFNFQHVTAATALNVKIGFVGRLLQRRLDCRQRGIGQTQEFCFGHATLHLFYKMRF